MLDFGCSGWGRLRPAKGICAGALKSARVTQHDTKHKFELFFISFPQKASNILEPDKIFHFESKFYICNEKSCHDRSRQCETVTRRSHSSTRFPVCLLDSAAPVFFFSFLPFASAALLSWKLFSVCGKMSAPD